MLEVTIQIWKLNHYFYLNSEILCSFLSCYRYYTLQLIAFKLAYMVITVFNVVNRVVLVKQVQGGVSVT